MSKPNQNHNRRGCPKSFLNGIREILHGMFRLEFENNSTAKHDSTNNIKVVIPRYQSDFPSQRSKKNRKALE